MLLGASLVCLSCAKGSLPIHLGLLQHPFSFCSCCARACSSLSSKPHHVGFFSTLLITFLSKPKSSDLNSKPLFIFFKYTWNPGKQTMKSEVSSSAKSTSTTGQDIWHSNLLKRELQALTELPGVWYKNQNGLLIPAKEVLFTWVSFLCTASRANCRMFLPCTWALNTVGTAAKSSLQGQGLWVWSATPKQHQFSCALHREKCFACLLQKYYKSTCTSCKRNIITLITQSFQKLKSASSDPFF